MRTVSEWTEVDLHELVAAAIPESLTLEYKASASLQNNNACRNELSKDVSALANSAGGRIIYGVVEQNHVPVRVDEGVANGGVDREWIEQIINSSIQPRIDGIVIMPIALRSGGTAYVIDVPQATIFAPHQANDLKYYKRFNFMCQAMHDYEIRDVLRRSSTGQPDVWFSWTIDAARKPEGLGGCAQGLLHKPD